MPLHLVFHKGDTMSLDRVGHYGSRLTRWGDLTQCPLQRHCVVSIHKLNIKAKRCKFLCKSTQVGHFLCGTETLKSIEIHHDSQRIQALVRGKDERFPCGPLIPFSVRHKTKDASRRSQKPFAEAQPGCKAKTVSEATRSKDHVRNP